MGDFKKLKVWEEGMNIVVHAYKITKLPNFKNDFGLIDQMRRCAVSIPSNIAEGDELDTNKQANRHFHIAKGSCAELQTQFLIAFRIGYIDFSLTEALTDQCNKISAMLSKLIKARL